MRYSDIQNQIRTNYNHLPRNQKILADFFIENFDRIPFLSVQEISKSSHTSVATVVRFAQRIGFRGFSEMRDAIADSLQHQIQRKEIFPLLDDVDGDTLTSVANQDINNINKTLKEIERKNFDAAVGYILNVDRVFTAGLGLSYLLAQLLAYQLTQVGIDSRFLEQGNASFLEQALYIKERDLVIAFSFPPYSRETVELASYLNQKNIKVISITNRQASPITFFSDLPLVVKSENRLYTNSFAAISVLINAISTECAVKNQERAEQMLEEYDRIQNIQKHFYL